MQHAHSILYLKAVDAGEQRIISGLASSPEVDRQGDIVEPMGAKLRTPLPLLLRHDHSLAVGTVTSAKATPEGIYFEATLAKITDAGVLRDRCEEAWGMVKAGIVRGVSIGFRAVAGGVEKIATGLRFTAYEVLELSIVAVPANASASIRTIKHFDEQALRSAGQPVILVPSPRPPVRLIPRERF